MSQGSDFSHLPVLFSECMEMLRIRPEGTYIDCTAGGGGHSSGILDRLNVHGRLISLDKDDDALSACERVRSERRSNARWDLVKADFSDIENVLTDMNIDGVDGILADLGVSSHQLDVPDRGFSYTGDGPLDMRMDQTQKVSAQTIIDRYTEEEIVHILRVFGEERYAGRIASAIVNSRKTKPVRTTGELSEIIMRAMPAKAKKEDQHPARRSFQAIRMEVNHELASIEKLLEVAPRFLLPQGRLAVISFHSLEDRLVKDRFRSLEAPCTCPRDFPVCTCNRVAMGKNITRKPIEATEEEARSNKRSRSAKLRVFERNCEVWKPLL